MKNHNLAEEYFLAAERLFREEEFVKGKEVLEEILDILPGSAKAHQLLGWVYYLKLSDPARAEHHLEQALNADPAYAPSYASYVFLLNDLNKEDKMREVIDKGMQVKGVKRSLMHNELGRLEEKKGDYAKAVENYRLALQHAMGKEEAALYRANILRAQGKALLSGKSNLPEIG